MFKPHFQFQGRHFNIESLRQWLAARRSHNPLLRIALGAVGVMMLLILLVLGAVIGTLMLLGGLAWRLLRGRGKPQASAQSEVLDGQYRVVGKSALPRGQ